MVNDFLIRYAEVSDEELLQIAVDRPSLTEEAVSALDAELSKRRLGQADLARHEQLVKQRQRREERRKSRNLRKQVAFELDALVTVFWTAVAISTCSIAYLLLPQQYRFSPDWEEAAKYVMFVSCFIAFEGSDSWGKGHFWISLVVSSAVHALVAHAWIVRAGSFGERSHIDGWPILLGGVIFVVVFGLVFLVRRKFYREEGAAGS